MLNVFFTVDTETWCNRWDNIDLHFADAFQRYIYGPTKQGNCGLPLTFDVLNDHGLAASFFVESLFALHFGIEPLQEVVSLVKAAGHEIQLHSHPEWVNESTIQLFEDDLPRRAFIRDFTLEQQTKLIKIGLDLFKRTGVDGINAFRAGSYGFNRNTLKALQANGILIDTSYNTVSQAGIADVLPEQLLLQPTVLDGVTIYPVSVFGGSNAQSLRPLQLTACSYREFETVLFHAVENEWDSVVIVSHSFELMTPGQERLDPIIFKRFKNLCKLLADHSDLFNVRGFSGLKPKAIIEQPTIPVSGQFNRCLRIGEQVIRRVV
jgi:peptidoglycan/xylan/chitin deacetylase (PgdA/CDA1 family)